MSLFYMENGDARVPWGNVSWTVLTDKCTQTEHSLMTLWEQCLSKMSVWKTRWKII